MRIKVKDVHYTCDDSDPAHQKLKQQSNEAQSENELEGPSDTKPSGSM